MELQHIHPPLVFVSKAANYRPLSWLKAVPVAVTRECQWSPPETKNKQKKQTATHTHLKLSDELQRPYQTFFSKGWLQTPYMSTSTWKLHPRIAKPSSANAAQAHQHVCFQHFIALQPTHTHSYRFNKKVWMRFLHLQEKRKKHCRLLMLTLNN